MNTPDPMQMMARYGRQLLVQGASLSAQLRLAQATAAIVGDGSAMARAAGEVAARYLVGAGVLTVVVPDAGPMGLADLDPNLTLLPHMSEATPPLASIYVAARPYGASVDVVAIDGADGWPTGRSQPARVATVALELGAAADAGDGAVVGAMAADLLVADVLGMAPLPASRRIRLDDVSQPHVLSHASTRQAPPAPPAGFADGQLLAELRAAPEGWRAVVDDAQACYPNEACGLLVRTTAGALRAIACTNLQDERHASDRAACPRTARSAFALNELEIAHCVARGETLLCIYHSHCDAGAYLSAEDVRCAMLGGQALYPGVAWLVLSVLGGSLRASAMYHLDPDEGVWLPEADPERA